MKNRIITNSFRTIKKSFSRFIPLLVMSFLGVFVFAGLQSIKPDMLITLDNFLDKHNVYDLKIISTHGMVENDLEKLSKIDGVNNVELSYSLDTIIKDNEADIVINVSSIPNRINTLELLKGNLPKNKNEIVVEENFLKKTNYKLGDKITIENDSLTDKEYTIVGTVKSGLYFNNDELGQDRGTTTVGTGIINYYTYILEAAFNQDYYNSVYLTIEGSSSKITSEDDYLNLVNYITDKVKDIKEEQEDSRYNEIYTSIEKEIVENETKVNNELNKAKNELDNAKKKLDSSKVELDNSKKMLATFKTNLDKGKKELENGKTEYQNTLKKYNIKEADIDSNINTINQNIVILENTLKNVDVNSNEYLIIEKQLGELKTNLNNLNQLKKAKDTLYESEKTYNSNLSYYNSSYSKYQKGLSEYNNGLNKYNDGLNEYNKNKKEAEDKLNEARKELEDLEKPTWYIQDRTDHQTYIEYIDDITSVNNLAKIFPIVFFAVAILVSLISMNRMVEEERVEIGTLKSLGFSNKSIIHKYLLFSSIATLLGGLIGGFLGILTLPALVSSIYGILFNVPNFYVGLNLEKIILSIIISILCICGTTIHSVLKVVKEKPSDLMRPKAPKSGKRILLERWTWFWNKIGFSNKVTIRNLFRYKKRGIVTIIGIAGCSSLMLCGFGIKDAIVDIANMQYRKTFTYDAAVYVNNLKESDEIFNNEHIEDTVYSQSINVRKDNTTASMFVASKDELSKIVNLVDRDNKKQELDSDSVVITDKFADLTNLQVGDTIELIDDNNTVYKYKIGGIAKNYLMHYIYVPKELFVEKNEFNPNIVYLNLFDINKEQEENLANELRSHDNVLNVSFIEEMLESANDMLTSLDKVVAIIIVLSAALSFVVLYNLSNININERKREISTLKVLGFHDKEVDNYITKENIIFTIAGILLGLFLGYFLTNIVIKTVEIEKARFIHHISLNSYIYTSIITILFTLIVNFVTHFNLKKIDMIASLKSVD